MDALEDTGLTPAHRGFYAAARQCVIDLGIGPLSDRGCGRRSGAGRAALGVAPMVTHTAGRRRCGR
jgi:hypothetical protein